MKKFFQNKLARTALIVFAALFCLLLLLNFVLMPWYVNSPEIEVTKVVGDQIELAKQKLEEAGFTPVIGYTTYDGRFPEGSVILQKPEAGEVVKQGRRIYLIISGGAAKIEVPELTGKSLADAKFALERINLTLGEINYVSSNSPKDVVVAQSKPRGSFAQKGSAVNVSLSLGEAEGDIVVPNLIGTSLSDAEKILQDLTLKVGKINYQPSFAVLPNTIIDQYPSKGSKVMEGTSVHLFITKLIETKEEINKSE